MLSQRFWIITTTIFGIILLAFILFFTSATFSRNVVTIAKWLHIPVFSEGVIERGGRSLVLFNHPPVQLTVLTSSQCTARICNVEDLIRGVKLNVTPAVQIHSYDISDERGKELVQQWNITHVPAFVFNETLVQVETYQMIADAFIERDGMYFLNIPSAVAIANLDATKNAPTSLDDDAVLGSMDAQVTIIEFSDFQCTACRSHFTKIMPALKKKYIDTGKVRFVYRDFPLSTKHPDAQKAAEAAGCAKEQGKFWEMHDKIFEGQNKLGTGTVSIPVESLKQYATELRLDMEAFNACFDSGQMTTEVQKDYDDGIAAGVEYTPTFFINGEKLVGAAPLSSFEALINK